VQRIDATIPRKSEKEVCDSFLNTRFARYNTTMTNYVGGNGNYVYSPTALPFPSPRVPVDQTARQIFKEATPEKTIGEILQALRINPNFNLVNNLRIRLTTPLYPYLKAVQHP
jgi:hypothetical protein